MRLSPQEEAACAARWNFDNVRGGVAALKREYSMSLSTVAVMRERELCAALTPPSEVVEHGADASNVESVTTNSDLAIVPVRWPSPLKDSGPRVHLARLPDVVKSILKGDQPAFHMRAQPRLVALAASGEDTASSQDQAPSADVSMMDDSSSRRATLSSARLRSRSPE